MLLLDAWLPKSDLIHTNMLPGPVGYRAFKWADSKDRTLI